MMKRETVVRDSLVEIKELIPMDYQNIRQVIETLQNLEAPKDTEIHIKVEDTYTNGHILQVYVKYYRDTTDKEKSCGISNVKLHKEKEKPSWKKN